MLGAADSAGRGAGEGGADLAAADFQEAAALPATSCFEGGGHGEGWNAKREGWGWGFCGVLKW